MLVRGNSPSMGDCSGAGDSADWEWNGGEARGLDGCRTELRSFVRPFTGIALGTVTALNVELFVAISLENSSRSHA